MARYAVIGATSWGLTLAWLLSRNSHEVVVICRTETEAQEVSTRRGIERLPEVRLPDAVTCLAPPVNPVFDGIVVAIPSQSLRRTVEDSGCPRTVPVLSAAKGIEQASGLSMTAVLRDLGWAAGAVAALSGPNLAHEIARGMPAAAVVASASTATAEAWQRALSGPMFRIYTSDDTAGVELAGAYKNVVAIAAGVGWGLQFGANAVSSIMTRGLAEMTRLGVALGADPLTFQGLAGVGDLATTCFSPLSRNRRFGELLAQGKRVEEAREAIGEAIEGITTAQVALNLASRHGIELPICAEVAAVVRGEKGVMEAMAGLLARPLRAEASPPR
jgi:glycerol-3-phosphate dehydrogenase (NAD(P)+)